MYAWVKDPKGKIRLCEYDNKIDDRTTESVNVHLKLNKINGRVI